MSGRLIVFSGPSGVGKDTIRKKLKYRNYEFSVSLTTREKRVGEVEGVNYHYVSREYFKERIEAGKMLEYAEFVGNYYGTDLEFVQEQLKSGKNVFLEIECQGAMQVLEKMDNVISIFILPPSIKELKSRLLLRGTETIEVIEKRIEKATSEIELSNKYKYQVTNDDLKRVAKEIDEILKDEIDG